MRGYWFSRNDGTTEHQKTPVAIGYTDTFDGEPIPCQQGLHWSPTPWDALQYAAGNRLWEVEGEGGVPHGDPIDKYAGTQRTPLRSVDLQSVTVEFSCRQAEGVLHLFEKQYPDDPRPRNSVEAARAFMRGEITKEQLDAVRAAAWDAAGDAAWAAARAAAWDAARDAAGDAAWDAARDAAGDAAWAAARAAARAAAWAAARNAARDAAWDAARAAARAAARDAAWDAAWAAARAAARAAAWAAARNAAGKMFNEMALAALLEGR